MEFVKSRTSHMKNQVTDQYEVLSELCTMFFFPQDQFVPVYHVGSTVMDAMKKSGDDGDVCVMAARALALALDKFSSGLHMLAPFKKSNKTQCNISKALKRLFAFTSLPNTAGLYFKRTTPAELNEEVLRCLTLASSGSEEVRRLLPPAVAQLNFCQAVMNSSKQSACKVLHHCCILARSGSLTSFQEQEQVWAMLRGNLEALGSLDVDAEWDELLRAVTESIVTLRCWCAVEGAKSKDVVVHTTQGRKSELKRQVLLSSSSSSGKRSLTQMYLRLCHRVCTQALANDARKGLVLACTNAVLSAPDLISLPTLSEWNASVDLILGLLRESTHVMACLSDPFLRNKPTATEAFEEDGFKSLPNLQWVLPPTEWEALVLMARLHGAEPRVDAKYSWAWRGENDTYYWYRPRDRAYLARSFFSAQKEATLKGGQHVVNLVDMIDCHLHTKRTTRVHFQCIPYLFRYDGRPLVDVISGSGDAMARVPRYDKLAVLQKVLQTLSFGSTTVARLAKMVYLHVVCQGEPLDTESTKVAFRNLVSEQPLDVLEELSSKLIKRDGRWAPILLEAGIADAMTSVRPSNATPRRKRARHEMNRAPSALPLRRALSRSPHQTASRSPGSCPTTSLIAEVIRETSSRVTAAQHRPFSSEAALPASTTSLLNFFTAASFSDFVLWLEGGYGSALGVSEASGNFSVAPVAAWVGEDGAMRTRMAAMLTTYTLQKLQKFAAEGKREELLETVGSLRACSLRICSPQPCNVCPEGHALRVHFSSNWQCNQCKQSTAFASVACRQCNYDLCYQCAEVYGGCMRVNSTSTAAEVLAAWQKRCLSADSEMPPWSTDMPVTDLQVLYTSDRIIAPAAPVSAFGQEKDVLHVGPWNGACRCGVQAPALCVPTIPPESDQSLDTRARVYLPLLSTCAADIAQDAGVTHALMEAVESHGTEIFLRGAAGLPALLRGILSALAPFLSLALKSEIARFICIECRRYALYHIQEANIALVGILQEEVHSNGLAHKISVARGKMDVMVDRVFCYFVCRCPSLRNKLEVEFEGEEGTGSGPTREFYAELSELYRSSSHLWYCQDGVGPVGFPTCTALYPRHFYVLGVLLARSFIDGYGVEVSLIPQVWLFLRASNPEQRSRALRELLQVLEPMLARSYDHITTASEEELAVMDLRDDHDQIITPATASAFVAQQTTGHLAMGCENLRTMALGLLTSVNFSSFWLLSDAELSIVLSGDGVNPRSEGALAKLFTESQLRAAVTEAHGYEADSRPVKDFISIVGGEFDAAQQRMFIEFLTGSSRLPLRGLAGLGRKITLVKKELEGKGEQTLPSCNTCFLYFKLPPYSTRDVMRQRLLLATTEGRKNFSLS